MSVSNQTNKTSGSGNSVTTTFSFSFKIFDTSELYVYLISATGVVTGPLVYTTDFTATINTVTEGGTITFIVAPATGTTWFVKRIVPYTQTAVIPSEGVFPGKQFENQLDLITMMVIQANETVTRCLQLPQTYLGTLPITIPSGQANAAIGWDPTGTFLTNVLVTAVGTLPVPVPNASLVTLTAANLVNGSSLFSLPSIPAAAGLIPVANIPVGTTANKIVQMTAATKLPAVDGSLLTGVVAASTLINANNSGSQLGAWASKALATAFQAATDGFVVAYSNNGGDTLTALTDAANPPTTVRSRVIISAEATSSIGTVFTPVRKGDYYKVTSSAGTATVFFIPMGS